MNPVYLEVEGRQFGLEARVRVKRGEEVLYRLDTAFFLFPRLRARIWALTHGLGWPSVK